MYRPLLPLTTLALLLSACGQSPPAPESTTLYGPLILDLQTNTLGKVGPQSLAGVTFTPRGPATVQTAGGFDYLRAQFEIVNTGSAAFDNLTLVAVAKGGNVGTTAFERISSFGGAEASSQASLAVRSVPQHPVVVTPDGDLELLAGTMAFQAFTTSEAATLTKLKGWAKVFTAGDRPLNYGFVASACTDDTCDWTQGRTINPGGRGLIQVALRIPHTSSAAYDFAMSFAVVNAKVSRVTRSVEPAESQAAASQRLTDLGVTSGGEVMTVGQPVTEGTPGRTDVNTPGLKVVSAPFVTTLAGSGQKGNTNGVGTNASFWAPLGLDVAADGTVYVVDAYNYQIRKITPAGVVTTFAGSGLRGVVDGTGTGASFDTPSGLTVDAGGNVYVGDVQVSKIRKITPSGVVTTVTGSIGLPQGLAVDVQGTVYAANLFGRKVMTLSPDGTVTDLAGTGRRGSQDGARDVATFDSPVNVAVDGQGNVLVSDTGIHKIRKITPDGVVSTVAGSGAEGAANGAAGTATFSFPGSLAVDASGTIYVADHGNGTSQIRKITPDGIVSTFVGSATETSSGSDGPVSGFTTGRYEGLSMDANGDLYFSDSNLNKVRKIYMP